MLEFHCPKCGDTVLVEVQDNVVVYTEINAINDDSVDALQYGDQENEGGEVVRYQCRKNGHPVVNDAGRLITTEEELVDWLTDNQKPEN